MGAVKRVKNVEWEKNRRERLNLTFFELSSLLPDHDPTLTLTKLEILNKSISYIKELQEKNINLLGTKHSEVVEAELASLREQVAELQRRNQQLAELLQTAKIPLPPRPIPHTTPFKCPRKWEGKLSAAAGIKNVTEKKKVESKENPVNRAPKPKINVKKKNIRTKKNIKTKEIKSCKITVSKSEVLTTNSFINPLRELNNASSVQSVPPKSVTVVSSNTPLKELNSSPGVNSLPHLSQTTVKATPVSHSDVKVVPGPLAPTNAQPPPVASVSLTSASVQTKVILSRTVTLPCTTISLVLSNSKTNLVTVAKSNVLPAPIMATGIQPVLQCNPSLSSLGPGTLIMPGGRIVPVPPPPAVLTPTLILLPPTTTTTVSVTTTRPPQKPTGSLRPIVPKPRQRDITKTTFANKVPIPATSTYRQGICADPKPLQNSNGGSHGAVKNMKKIIVKKHDAREKYPTVIDKKSGKVLDSNCIEGGEINSKSSISKDLIKETVSMGDKETTQCVSKRKCEIRNENIKESKMAKIVGKSVENVGFGTDSNKLSRECNNFSNDFDAVDKSEGVHDNGLISNKGELNLNEVSNANDVIVEESSTVVSVGQTKDIIPPNTGSAISSQNCESEKESRSDDVIASNSSVGSDKSLCDHEDISQNKENKSNKNVPEKNPNVLNDAIGGSQISKEVENNAVNSVVSSLQGIEVSHSVNSSNVVKQVISQSLTDGNTEKKGKGNDLLGTERTNTKKSHNNDKSVNEILNNTNDNIVCNDNHQMIQSNTRDNAQQLSGNSVVKGAYLIDNLQQDITLPPNSSPRKVDGSTQINLNCSSKSVQRDEVFNQNCYATTFSNGDPTLLRKNTHFSPPQRDLQHLNVNKRSSTENRNQISLGGCLNQENSNLNMNSNTEEQNIDVINISGGKSQIISEGSLHLENKAKVATQSDHRHSKLQDDQTSADRVFLSKANNIINSGRTEDCYDCTSENNNFNLSNQQNLCTNIYSNDKKDSQNSTHFNMNERQNANMKPVPYTVSSTLQTLPNSGSNNNFNFHQSLHHSCPDSLSSKNNPNMYNERFNYNERIQQNVPNKTIPALTDQSAMSLNFQKMNPNHVKVVSDSHAQTINSGNFFANNNYQNQSNENINTLGNKTSNTIPVGGNNKFVNAYPCSDASTNLSANFSSSSTNHTHFTNPHSLNPCPNHSSSSSNVIQNVTEATYPANDQSKHIPKNMDSKNLHQVHASKNNNCQKQQEVSKDGCLQTKLTPESVKTSVSQNCKSTQVTSLQLLPDNEKNVAENKQQNKQNPINSGVTKPVNNLKPVCDNKSIQEDSQELTSLFPSEKLQSCSESLFKDTCAEFRDRNLFMPVSHSYMEEMRLNLPHSDFSNDLLSSLQVPNSGSHPESISPTAAFLLAFPLVSTSKTSELIAENEGSESQHATSTTILQIGNIESTSSELFHQTALMIENNPNILKQSKHADNFKDQNLKQNKDIETFNKFQQIEINELMRNDNFSRNNNYKDKKNCIGLGDQDVFYQCTKKKSNNKTNNYTLNPSMVHQMQDKPYEFSQNNIRSNPEEGRQLDQNEKKNQTQTNNGTNSQSIYNSSSQPFTYSSFPSNEFMLPNSNFVPSNNQSGTESSKSMPLASSNFNVISWTTASITSSSTQVDYTTPYCSYPQKPYSNSNQIKMQKNSQNNFEDQRNKDKTISNVNSLPKFSNFHFNNNHPNQDPHGYIQTNQSESNNFKLESKTKKLKTGAQRAPVNWMTAPDVRPLLPDNNMAPVLPEVMFQHQKELDFPPVSNNMMMLNSSSNINSFNTTTSTSNNSQSFYPNSHFSGVDLQLDFAPFPDMSTTKPLRNPANIPNTQQNPHPYSWSPSKSSIPLIPHIDSHMIPSTLPTLVGDLALGTTTPSGPIDTFRNLSMPTTPFNIEAPVKKYEKKHESPKSAQKTNEKDSFTNSERRNNRTVPEYCQKTHTHQSTNTSSSFLSVSQLVDQVKTEQNPSSRRTSKPSNTKANSSQKRNTSNQQSDKSKVSNNNHISYHNSNPGMMSQRKFDTQGVYQDIHNTGMGFPGSFPNQGGPMPWQTEKPFRSNSNYKGSYSAESLIADQTSSTQGHVTDLPQFPNQYSHPPVVSSASYPSADFTHQNVQPLEFHQTPQNCFNFPSNSHYTSASFNSDGDYHLGLDHLFNFNSTTNKQSTSCQTSAKDSRSNGKRGQSKQRREEVIPQWTPHVYATSVRPKGSLPPHCPPNTSSPSHQGTTTLTNFNLSTIFPEINDKVGMTGPPSTSNFPPPSNFRPH